MLDLSFSDQVPPAVAGRLKKLGAWFEEYATEGLLGQGSIPAAWT